VIKALIFDLDGVIVDSESLHKTVWQKYLIKIGYDFSIKEVVKFTRGRTAEDALKNIFGNKYSDEQIKKWSKEKRDLFYKEYKKGIKKVAGIQSFLEKIKQAGYKTAIASSGSKRRISYTLNKFGFKKYFDVVVTAENVRKSKPDPEIYLITAKKTKPV
jgi:beta-phosphoglucomutase-like phosphatase (HAD superfamily)